jgi:hypothetical protein
MATTNFQAFSGDVEVASNLQVGTANLFVDITTGQVGIGKTNPTQLLDIVGNVAANVNTLFVNTVTSRVGIGTSEPSTNFDVNGNVNIGSTLTVSGFRITAAAAAEDDLQAITNAGADTTNQIHITNGTRAISSSTGALRVGDSGAPGGIGVVGNVYVGDTVTTQDLSVNNVISDFAVNTDDFFVDISESKVGVSTTQPHAELHVVGNVYVSSNLTVDADTLHVDAANDRVGVNTKNPEASLHLVGNAYVSGDLETDSDILMSSNVFIKGPGPTSNVVAIGIGAGYTTQGLDSVAIGTEAGKSNQGVDAISIGRHAGSLSQNNQAISIGYAAGILAQGFRGVAIGLNAGYSAQGESSIAIGRQAGNILQGSNSVALGRTCGYTGQGVENVAVGYNAGHTNQVNGAVAIGKMAGCNTQESVAVAVGFESGLTTQGANSVGVGYRTGRNNQDSNAVAVGVNAGCGNQNQSCVAVGASAGKTTQEIGSVAIGASTGETNQGCYSVCLGQTAGTSDPGSRAVCIGLECGYLRAGEGGVYIGHRACFNPAASYGNSMVLSAQGAAVNPNRSSAVFMRRIRNSGALSYSSGDGEVYGNSSDDRVKHNETYIKNAVQTIMKLKPQTYDKCDTLDANAFIEHRESGFMAQDLWYDVPEMKHIVVLARTANPTPEKPPAPSDDPADDPDYSTWGEELSTLNYQQIIPFLAKAIQEIVVEVPRAKTTVSNTWGQNITGLVVSANTNKHKTNTVPLVSLSNVSMDKSWYGVVSGEKTDSTDYDVLVDTKGDTQIWVTDLGGPLESGDLLTTSNIAPGFTQKQSDDLLRSSTVAKVTQDCDFTEPSTISLKVPRRELSNVTYYIHQGKVSIDKEEYDIIGMESKKTTDTVTMYRKASDRSETTQEMYDKLDPYEQEEYDSFEKLQYYRLDRYETKFPRETHDITEVRQELVDVIDENGQIVWEETDETRQVYTLIDHGTYKSALVTCKLI